MGICFGSTQIIDKYVKFNFIIVIFKYCHLISYQIHQKIGSCFSLIFWGVFWVVNWLAIFLMLLISHVTFFFVHVSQCLLIRPVSKPEFNSTPLPFLHRIRLLGLSRSFSFILTSTFISHTTLFQTVRIFYVSITTTIGHQLVLHTNINSLYRNFQQINSHILSLYAPLYSTIIMMDPRERIVRRPTFPPSSIRLNETGTHIPI